MPRQGICHHHKASKPTNGGGRYVIGQKRCQTCAIYLNWKDLWCPCCGKRLRTKPRNKTFKLALRENQKISTSKPYYENLKNL